MANMVFEAVDSIVVVVHSSDPPSSAEWQAGVDLLSSIERRVGIDATRSLIFTDGGGPNYSQRQALNKALRGRSITAAVVSTNAFVRGIVAGLNLFNSDVKTFQPEALERAFDHLRLTSAQRKHVLRTLEKLRANMRRGV